jgi:hypothetical protein
MSLPAASVLDPNRIPGRENIGGRKGESRCGSELSRDIYSCRIPFLAVFLASLCLFPATAQKSKEPSPPKYDLHVAILTTRRHLPVKRNRECCREDKYFNRKP